MTDKFNFEEVKASRQKWIEFLRKKGRKKSFGYLDQGNGERCCLGHACYVLGVEKVDIDEGFAYGAREEELRAPGELLKLLGLRGSYGELSERVMITSHYTDDGPRWIGSLAVLNDQTAYSPKMIGDFIEEHYDSVFLNEHEYRERYCING